MTVFFGRAEAIRESLHFLKQVAPSPGSRERGGVRVTPPNRGKLSN
jgi:hypothetical protein